MKLRLTFLTLALTSVVEVEALKVQGAWSSQDAFFTVLTKFGFQKTDANELNRTRGYVFGNVTSNVEAFALNMQGSSSATLVLANRPHFRQIYAIWRQAPTSVSSTEDQRSRKCSDLMNVVDAYAFDARCLKSGSQDVLRKVPCAKNQLCADEDDASNVFPGYQLTYRVQDKAQARYWFLLLVACRLDEHCNWTSSNATVDVGYNVWLVNGHPNDHLRRNPFEHQFSCEEQDLFEIIAAALIVNIVLVSLQCRATKLKRNPRSLLVMTCLVVQSVELVGYLIHVSVFAVDGHGSTTLRSFASFLHYLVDALLIFLLILLAKGWTIRSNVVHHRSKTLLLYTAFLTLHLIFYFWAVNSIDELEEMYMFDTWPGWGILLVRVLAMAWFIVEVRISVNKVDEQKQMFFLHFASGFLVWFVYLPLLGAISSHIPVMYRYKATLSLSYLADFVAFAILIHLFYPRSTNRLYFLGASAIAEEFDDEYDKAIIMDDLDNVDDIDDKSPSTSNGRLV